LGWFSNAIEKLAILMYPRLQNKTNWTYCIKSKAALIQLYPNDLKQKTCHNQVSMLDCDWSHFALLEAIHLSFSSIPK
jgi:hypothetical protein